ncbi:MAG TPA: MarR family winged helix-turn-helix transcriptional regulator [Actinomycetota bacterium]|nr:MarR family winged helix-turn-helix transcriptional regulator [Actinomycetota bacterium]
MRSEREAGDQRLGLGPLLLRLLYHYRQAVTVEAEKLGFGDIRSPHLQVLAHISSKGTRLTKLAERAQLSLAAASEFVSELEELGYVSRRVDPADRRAKLIVPTARGRKAFTRGAKGAAEIERRWALLVGDERFEEALDVMQDLLDGLGMSEPRSRLVG